VSDTPDELDAFIEKVPEPEQQVETQEAEPDVQEDTSDEVVEETTEEQSEVEEEPDEEPAPELYTVKVDGKERQVTLDQLKQGFSSQSHIQERLSEIKAAETRNRQVFEQLSQQQQQFLAYWQQVQQQGFVAPPAMPDAQLAYSDPVSYTQQLAEYNAGMAAYQAQQRQIQAAQAQQEAATQAAMQAHIEAQYPVLTEAIPEFRDPQKARDHHAKLTNFAKKHGITDEQLASVYDAAPLIILDKAMRYDALKAAQVQKKVLPPAAKTVKPTAKRPEPPQLARGKIIAKATQSQSGEDWTQAFLEPKR
jgi:hypothetical protein